MTKEAGRSDVIEMVTTNARDAGYAKGLLSGFLLCFDNELNIRDREMLELCIKNAKEFIEKDGKK